MASRVPRNIPVAAIASLITGGAATSVIGYLLYNGVFSGAWSAGGMRARPACAAQASILRSSPAVKPGEKALKFNRIHGVLPDVISEGTHLAIPWFERPIIFDVRTRPRAIKSVTGTRGEHGKADMSERRCMGGAVA